MSIKQCVDQLESLKKKRQGILRLFTSPNPLIVGSITQTKGRCGKPNCACAKQPCHPITLLMTKKNGKKRCQLVRKNDIDRVFKQWMEYKKLILLLKQIGEYNAKEFEALREIILKRAIDY